MEETVRVANIVFEQVNNGMKESVVINGSPLVDDEDTVQDESTTGTLSSSSSSETTIISTKPTASLPDTLEAKLKKLGISIDSNSIKT